MRRNGFAESKRAGPGSVSEEMIWEVDASSIPGLKSQTMISLCRVVDQPSQAVYERTNTYKPNSILKNEGHERKC